MLACHATSLDFDELTLDSESKHMFFGHLKKVEVHF